MIISLTHLHEWLETIQNRQQKINPQTHTRDWVEREENHEAIMQVEKRDVEEVEKERRSRDYQPKWRVRNQIPINPRAEEQEVD